MTNQNDEPKPVGFDPAPGEKGRNWTFSRRALLGLGLAGAGAVGASLGVTVDRTVLAPLRPNAPTAGTQPYFGTHQAGVVTAVQDRLHFASFDVGDIDRAELIELLKDWSLAASRMTQGLGAGPNGATGGSYDSPPDDTGEALDLPPSSLTITFGFGPSLFTSASGVDRFGIAGRRPEALVDLPHFPADALQPELTGGDICIQACSDDPQVAVHAIRNLSRIAFGRAAIRWSQLGFGRTSSTSRSQVTERNLFGFKDGTSNITVEDQDLVDSSVWANASDGAAWMDGGTYLVARKIRMTIEVWDHQSLREQERVVGRTKREGAPLSGGTEFTPPDFTAQGASGAPLIDRAAHVRLAHPSANNGMSILRRGYNFVDGNDSLGRLNAGLFFISFQRDPRTQYIPLQNNLAKNDAMKEYFQHIGSGIFAVPPGAADGEYVGAGLFA